MLSVILCPPIRFMQYCSYSIIEASLVSRMWSVRIHGIDISMGNWMRRPIVSSRKNSRNQSWERSQHCWSVSETQHGKTWPLTSSTTLLNESVWGLTTKVEQVSVEEGLPVKLLDVQDGGPLQTAAQSFLRAALISHQRLQHRPDHIQLCRRTERRCRWKDKNFFCCLKFSSLFFAHNRTCFYPALSTQTHISILLIISPQVGGIPGETGTDLLCVPLWVLYHADGGH